MSNAPLTMITWATLHRVHARVRAQLTRRMEAERGVSVLEHGSLYELNRAPQQRLLMADLADRLGLSPSAATRLIDRIEDRRWVRREIPKENRRTVNVIITAEGRRAYVRNNRLFTTVVEEAVAAHLSEQEMSTLISLLGRLSGERSRS